MNQKLVPASLSPEQRREADAAMSIQSTHVDRYSIHLSPKVTRIAFAEVSPLDGTVHMRVAVTMGTVEAISLAKTILALADEAAKLGATASAGSHGEAAN